MSIAESDKQTTVIGLSLTQGAYKFDKIKFPEFSRFSRPSNQTNIK